MIYGCESWIIDNKHEQQLNAFATSCYRIMLHINKKDHIKNSDLYERTNTEKLYKTIIKRQLEFIGHILRLPKDEPSRLYALYEPTDRLEDAKTKRGKTKTTYATYITHIMFHKSVSSQTAKLEANAANRDTWKKLVTDRLKTIDR